MAWACRRWRRWCWLAALIGFLAYAGPLRALTLTAEERAWLDANSPVVVGVAPPTPFPFAYYTVQLPDNRPGAEPIVSGYAADLMALLAQRAGMQIRYQAVTDVRSGLELVRAGKIHMTPVLRMTPERRQVLTMPEPLAVAEAVWVVRRDAPPMDQMARQPGLRAAVPPDTPLADSLRQAFPLAQMIDIVAEAAGIPMVADGRADITLVDLYAAIQTIERNRLPGVQIRRVPQVPEMQSGPAIGVQYPLLHSIISKALASVSPAERTLLARRWLPQGVGTPFDNQTALLDAQEQAWVQRQPKLRVGFDANLPPLSQAAGRAGAGPASSAEEDFSGLAADTLRLAVKKAGLQLGVSLGVAADELPRLASTGEIDIAVGLARTPANEGAFLLVGPYLRAATVIAMPLGAQQAAADVHELVNLDGVAMLRSEPSLPELRSRFPGLRVLLFDHLDDALLAVAQGRAGAALGNAFAMNHLIQQRHAGRLHVTGVVRDGDLDLYFGVPRAQPQLARVLALGFEALTPSDTAALRQRWLLVRIEQGLKWAEVLRWVLPVAAALLGVLAVLALANRRLREAHRLADRARAEAEDANAARGRFLAYLAHEVRGLVNSIGWGARLMLARHPQASPEQVAGWIKSSAESTGHLLESTLENERALAHGVTLAPAAHDLAAWWQETLAPHELTAASKGVSLQLQAPRAAMPLRFDALRLAQTVHNLVGNAIKFTTEGEVVVTGRWDPAAARLRVEVLDSGPGLASGEVDRLWEPYTQGAAGRSLGTGAGLGLAITREIIKAMGGTVQAEARPQRGSRFCFEVPLEIA